MSEILHVPSSDCSVVSSHRPPTPIEDFTALLGSWSFERSCARYSGALNRGDRAGLALSDVSLCKGTVKATVTFDTDTIEDISGGIVLGHSDQSGWYLTVQLAAYNAKYAVAEYVPGKNDWSELRTSGDCRNIAPRTPYAIEVVQLESSITLVVNGVKVLDHDLGAPLDGDRVGLFGWGGRDITFENVCVQPAPRLFVAMPFEESFDNLYRQVIVPTAREVGFDVVRMDEVLGPGDIHRDIKTEILQADCVLAEITSQNANVILEVGIALAHDKRVVLLAQRGTEPPFDLRTQRLVYYNDRLGAEPELRKTLQQHLTAAFATGQSSRAYVGAVSRQRSLASHERDGIPARVG